MRRGILLGCGLASAFLVNSELRAQFAAFFARPDSFSLGVCNGCQTLAQLKTLIPGAAHWQILAKSAMQDDLASLQRTVTQEVVVGGGSATAAHAMIAVWQDRNQRPLDRIAKLLAEVRAAGEPDASMLSVALREMRNLA